MSSALTLGLRSSVSSDWTTPDWLYRELDAEFGFDLDVAASDDNAKCDRYYTLREDGLRWEWAPFTCWMNPPYGKTIGLWVQKAQYEAGLGATVVGLLPARTDTAWWHDYCEKHERRFIRGRLTFGNLPVLDGYPTGSRQAPFPSAIVIWRPAHDTEGGSDE